MSTTTSLELLRDDVRNLADQLTMAVRDEQALLRRLALGMAESSCYATAKALTHAIHAPASHGP